MSSIVEIKPFRTHVYREIHLSAALKSSRQLDLITHLSFSIAEPENGVVCCGVKFHFARMKMWPATLFPFNSTMRYSWKSERREEEERVKRKLYTILQ